MPELPEVETTLNALKPHLNGEVFHHVIVRETRLRWPVPDKLNDTLANLSILNLSRRGKYILIHCDKGTLIIHLGMSGRLKLLTHHDEPMRHDHVDFILSSGLILRYHDPRRFGAILWTNEPPAHHVLLKSLGPEPLEDDFTGEYLFAITRNRRLAIKLLIMNAACVVGVGNIYANEALFLSGIHPEMPAKNVKIDQCNRLVLSIKSVLMRAIQQGGTTLKDFINPLGKPGYFTQQLNVYGREGLACFQCQSVLKAMRLGQRTTVYCNVCQPE